MGVLIKHELFAWAHDEIRCEKFSLKVFCFLLFDHYYGPVAIDSLDAGKNVLLPGFPDDQRLWPSWRCEEGMLDWGRCFDTFQLTFLRNELVSSYLPLLTYAIFCLAEGRYLAGPDSTVSCLLRYVVSHLQTGGASSDLLTGSERLPVASVSGLRTGAENSVLFPEGGTRRGPCGLSSSAAHGSGSSSLDLELISDPNAQDLKARSSNKLDRMEKVACPGVKRPDPTNMRVNTKRRKPDDDVLDLDYESDGELGALASGRELPKTRADIEVAWKADPRFIRFGFEENIQLAPLKFRTHVTMQNVCSFCANTGHKSANRCKKRQRLVKEHGKESSCWPIQCLYPYCDRAKTHLVAACPVLQSKCPKCSRRGHGRDRCPVDKLELEEARRVFQKFCPLGRYTGRSLSEPAWSWMFDAGSRLSTMVVLQGVKSRRFLEWDVGMGDPIGKKDEELEKIANTQYWK